MHVFNALCDCDAGVSTDSTRIGAIEALQAEVSRLRASEDAAKAATAVMSTPLRDPRVAKLAQDSTPVPSLSLSIATGSPFSPAESLTDANPGVLTLSVVVLTTLKVNDAIETRDAATKSLNTVRHKIRAWLADFEAREGRKPEKTDKKAIREGRRVGVAHLRHGSARAGWRTYWFGLL